ncbi:hypothetical protein BDV11DRAFT_173521 [Aspergillus similis]
MRSYHNDDTTKPAITTGGLDYAERVAGLSAAAFASSHFTAYIRWTLESTWSSDIILESIIGPHFQKSIASKAETGAILVEAGGFAAAAAPPDIFIPVTGVTDLRILEFLGRFAPVKEEFMHGRDVSV